MLDGLCIEIVASICSPQGCILMVCDVFSSSRGITLAASDQQSTPSQTTPSNSDQSGADSSATGQKSSSTATSPTATGTTTLDAKSGSVVGIVALKGLNGAADTIAHTVLGLVGQDAAVLIVEDRALALSDAPNAEITGRFAAFKQRFAAAQQALTPPPPPVGAPQRYQPDAFAIPIPSQATITAASGIVGLATDVVGMFKSDYSVQGRDVTLGYSALAAAVAGRLNAGGKTAIIDGFTDLSNTNTLVSLNELLEARAKLEALAQQRQALELDRISAEIDALNARITAATGVYDKAREDGKPDVSGTQALIADLTTQLAGKQSDDYVQRKALVAAATALIASFDQYVTAMSTVPNGQKYPPIVAAALRDVLHDGIQVEDRRKTVGFVLYLEVTGAGGDLITRSGLFSSNRKVGVVGALQATYMLIEPAGNIRAAHSIGHYSTATLNVTKPTLTWTTT